jgi:4-hydroxyacetophenone monooxygenase
MARQELLEATDEQIDEAIKFADPLILRGVLYQLTGDEELVGLPVGEAKAGFIGEIPAIVDPDAVALVQRKAADFLKAYRDAGAGDYPLGSRERLVKSMELATGRPIPAAELEMWMEQLAIDPMPRGLQWRQEPAKEAKDNFLVAVIGAGMGGIGSAVHLKQAGIPFVVIEKNGGVGGTWHENRYPGARVDTMSKIYFHSFGVNYQCPNPFCEQKENEKYFNWATDTFGIRDNIVFNTEVKSMVWNEADKLWDIDAVGPDGPVKWRANGIISGVGFLNRPNVPQFKGADNFKGTTVHTARWPADLDYAGKRVAVIGSGATGYQMVPEMVKKAGQLTLFQQVPSWCFEMPGYLSPYPEHVNWLDRNLPFMINFVRFKISWLGGPDILMKLFAIDPGFKDEHTVSAESKRIRELCLEFLGRKFGERPDLFEKMLPVAPPMTSRPVLVDPEYNIYDALLMDHVELVTEPIAEFTADGIRTADGQEHPFDIIVCATGFKPNDFLFPMEVRGRGGKTIEQLWEKDGARAYLGTMIPGFPNLFMLYGPNMNPFGNGLGVIEMEEMAIRFALKCFEGLILEQRKAVDVSMEGYQRFNAELDKAEATRVYSDWRVTSYFKNDHQRSAVNNPLDVRRYWNWMREPAGEPTAAAKADPVVRARFGEDLEVD